MGLQPGVRGGGRKGASITALGDVMSRWPGATERGPVPTLQQSKLSSAVGPPRLSTGPRDGGHTGLVKRREEEDVSLMLTSRCFKNHRSSNTSSDRFLHKYRTCCIISNRHPASL